MAACIVSSNINTFSTSAFLSLVLVFFDIDFVSTYFFYDSIGETVPS